MKNKIIIVCSILALFTSTAFPQDTSQQTNLFPNITGNAKIDSLNSYAYNLEKSNSALQMLIGKQCYDLSKSNNYELGLIQSLNNIGTSYFHKLSNDTALTYFKKAFSHADKIKNYVWKIKAAINIAEAFYQKHQLDSSIVFYKKGMANAVKLKDSVSTALIYNLLGFTHWRKGGFSQAIRYYKESLKIHKKLGNNKKTEKVLNNLGSAYYQLSDYQIALEYYIEGLDVRKRYTDTDSPILLNNIGLIYLNISDMKLASSYFTRGLIAARKTNDILGEGYSLLNKGDINFRLEKYKVALESYKNSILFYKKLNDMNGVAKITNRIGQIYLATNQLKLAEAKFSEAYRKCKDNGLKLTQTVSLINFVKIQVRKLENYDGKISSNEARKIIYKANRNLKRAYRIATEENYKKQKLEIYFLQSQLHSLTKEFETALIYYRKYDGLKDSLFNEKGNRILTNTKEKYEADRKEKENNYLKYINSIQNLEIENKQTVQSYIITFSVFSFFLIIYLIYLNTLRKRKNSALLNAKREIELINNSLNTKNKELEQLNSTKDKFFSIIAHDLKNPFNTLLGASQILKMDDGGNSEEDKKELIDIIANDTEKLYNLLENLLFWSRSQTGNLKAKTVNIKLYDMVCEIVKLFKSSYDKKNIRVDINVPKEFVVKFDEFMLNTIIRNLLSNAIKFSFYDGKISFQAIEKDNKIYLQIADSGMGIKEENINKLFDESSDYKRLGTDNEKGTGLGLILCRDFAKENGATINVTSKIDKGTTFELVLKKV